MNSEEAFEKLEDLARNNNLPESLRHNTIGAEPRLFREA